MRRQTFRLIGPCVALMTIAACGCRRSNELSSGSQPAVVSRARSGTDRAAETWQLEPPASVAAELARLDEAEDVGAAVFEHYCAVCHGPEGKGNGIYYADNLQPKPTDLTNAAAAQTWTDQHMEKLVREGSAGVGKSALCPPWGRVFSDEQVAAVVKYAGQFRKNSDTPKRKGNGRGS